MNIIDTKASPNGKDDKVKNHEKLFLFPTLASFFVFYTKRCPSRKIDANQRHFNLIM